jgi:hypothetical protein
MNFDDLYMLKLGIRLSDYDAVKRYYSKVRNRLDDEVQEYLNMFCTDIRIIEMFEKNKKFNFNIFQMLRSTFNNDEIVRKYLNKFTDVNKFDDRQSFITTLLRNNNTKKKITIFQNFLSNPNFILNTKNHKGETNSQILLKENPTDTDAVFLEKLEKTSKNRTLENSYLFFSTNLPKEYNKQQISNFINSSQESVKINLEDIEFHLLKLNLKLRKMFDFSPIYLSDSNTSSTLSQLHLSILHNFILNKLILEKI